MGQLLPGIREGGVQADPPVAGGLWVSETDSWVGGAFPEMGGSSLRKPVLRGGEGI